MHWQPSFLPICTGDSKYFCYLQTTKSTLRREIHRSSPLCLAKTVKWCKVYWLTSANCPLEDKNRDQNRKKRRKISPALLFIPSLQLVSFLPWKLSLFILDATGIHGRSALSSMSEVLILASESSSFEGNDSNSPALCCRLQYMMLAVRVNIIFWLTCQRNKREQFWPNDISNN